MRFKLRGKLRITPFITKKAASVQTPLSLLFKTPTRLAFQGGLRGIDIYFDATSELFIQPLRPENYNEFSRVTADKWPNLTFSASPT